ncbi:MAG: cytochrome c biogenesis protein ResB [Bdellovibrionales bacterium]|nr:cytochrome c biogenesis protein ResB [Bdellovibrionales bacterium]
MKKFRKIGEALARTDIFFYTLIWLSVLTFVGTIAQRYVGLYQAQHTYFSSWYFWFGYLPLPGAYPAMWITFIGLVAKLIFKTRWVWKDSGTIIMHFGGALLLFGGFLTAYFSEEGNMAIMEGEKTQFVSDYHKVELTVVETTAKNEKDRVYAFSEGWLKEGEILEHKELPVRLEVQKYCENCRIRRRSGTGEMNPMGGGGADLSQFKGFAKRFEMLSAPSEVEAEQNRSGIQYRVRGADESDNKIFISFLYMDHDVEITAGDRTFRIVLQKEQRQVPFTVELVDFEQGLHPGTGMARSYKSVIHLIDGDIKEKRVIQMNEPLRYKGYTLFQSSFVQGQGPMMAQTSVFAVVKNMGRLFPYISSLIMCFGLLIHLGIQIPKLIRRRKETNA